MEKKYFDIGFVIPLQEEYEELANIFEVISDELVGDQFQAVVNTGREDVTAVAFLQPGSGRGNASRCTDALLKKYDVGIIVVLGIAGGVSDDVSIGDVCISSAIADITDNSKITSDKAGGQKIEFNPVWYHTDTALTFGMKYIKLSNSLKSVYDAWAENCYYVAAEKISVEFIGRKNKNEMISIPSLHDGAIVCGSVSKSNIYRSSLTSMDRKIIALETEAGGVFAVASQLSIPVVVVRGICDYADDNKNKLEEQTSGQARKVAIHNAVSMVKSQLGNPNFVAFLTGRRQSCLTGLQSELEPIKNNILTVAKVKIADEIDERLRELSPDYKTKPKGYRLPIPRIKVSERAELEDLKRHNSRSDYHVGILEALVQHKISAVEVPRGYPDNSLPWVIANELLNIELEGLPALPIILCGEDVTPPNGTFSHHSIVDLAELSASESCRLVFIVDKTPYNSRSKSNFLAEQIRQYPEARFLLISKADENIEKKNDLILSTGAVSHQLTEISFFEITDFIKRTFSIPDQEAGVIAFKLKKAFNKFNLNIHPSYFSGVASDNLSALLHANRRAELIQLAVTGFLSFVVASDKGDVALSRTTRERFLRELAFEIRVNLRSYSKAELVQFTQTFADNGAFEIDPLTFVTGFVDKGILHFDNDKAGFALPFMESYLLASILKDRPKEAGKYFSLSVEKFDFPTFDIYAELGPDREIVDRILTEMDQKITDTLAGQAKDSILLNDEIRPPAANKPERYEQIQKQLARAMDDVVTNRPNAAAKQKLLDVADRVRDGVEEAKRRAKNETDEASEQEIDILSPAFKCWQIASTLIGSASEHLDGKTKAALSERIVRITALLLDRWTRQVPPYMTTFKEYILSEESLRTMLSLSEGQVIDQTQRDLVTSMVEGYEFLLLGMPFHAMLQYLCDQAGQPVLGLTVNKVNSEDLMEGLIAAIWAAEISAHKAKDKLKDAIEAIPPTPFFRQCLVSYFMTRVYWNQANKNNQVALLDAANAAIRPLGKQFDKARILREISSDVEARGVDGSDKVN